MKVQAGAIRRVAERYMINGRAPLEKRIQFPPQT
jgi:hypothetical protein